MSISTIDVNVSGLTTPYKRADPESKLKIGTWLANFADVRIVDGGITTSIKEDCVSDISNECLLAPIVLRLNQRSMHYDVSVRITYRYGEFSYWDSNDDPHWVSSGTDTYEFTIPAYSVQGEIFLIGIYDSCEVLKVELLTQGDVDLDFTLLGLAVTNTKFLYMMLYETEFALMIEVFFNRFVYYHPSWDDEDETYPRGRLPLTAPVAELKAQELKVLKKSYGETHEQFCQRIQGKRYWVIPRNSRGAQSNIHYLMARYLDLAETDIYIYEKQLNITAENPDDSDRDRIWTITEQDGWTETDGVEFNDDGYLVYEEDIKNKNFSTRTYNSSINAIDQYWQNVFDNDGQFNNTEELVPGNGYCFIVSSRGASDDARGYAAFSQKVDFTQMTRMELDVRLESIPNHIFTPPGPMLGRFWIVASNRYIGGYNTNIADIITTGTVLYTDEIYYEDWPSPTVTRLSIDVSGLTGEMHLYFIVRSDMQFVSSSIDRIYYTYGIATTRSPIIDILRTNDILLHYPYYSKNDPDATIEWRVRVGDTQAEMLADLWSTWRDVDDTTIDENGRYMQFEFRFTSTTVQPLTPVTIADFHVLAGYVPYHDIILDPTFVVSMPAEQRGDNYMWSYASLDQARFKEIVDSLTPMGVTPRTEFYLEEISDVL